MIKFSKYPVGQEAMKWDTFSPAFNAEDIGKTHLTIGVTLSNTQIFVIAALSCTVFGITLASMVAALFI